MRTEQSPATSRTRGGVGPVVLRGRNLTTGVIQRQGGIVDFYGNAGVMMHPPGRLQGKPADTGGKRGKVGTWSKSSRRRMRYALLRYEAPPGCYYLDATFTIPGPVMAPAEARKLWADFCHDDLDKRGWSALWRVEVQMRGALHWHAEVITPDKLPTGIKATPWITERGFTSRQIWEAACADALRRLWLGALRRLGPRLFSPAHRTRGGRLISSCSSLADMPCAEFRACVVQREGGRQAWLRYMQDHATKAKQEQIGEDIGRHWGVVGRKRLVLRKSESLKIDGLQFCRFRRVMQRLSTSSKSDDSKPFGRVLCGRNRRGLRGRSVWFTRPETARRLMEWACSEKEDHESVQSAVRG